MSIPGVFDYTGRALVEVQSTETPGVVKLTIHTLTTSTSALLDSYALMELRTIIQKTLERTNDK